MPPEDSISDLSFSPQSAHLAVASWDKKVRIYEVNASGGEGKAYFEHEAPVLSCDWSPVRLDYPLLHEDHLTDARVGRFEGRGSRSGQSCTNNRLGRQPNQHLNPDGSSRPTYPMCSLLYGTSGKRTHVSYRLLGQDDQILGFTTINCSCYCTMPGACLHVGCQRKALGRWNGRSIYQCHQPRLPE